MGKRFALVVATLVVLAGAVPAIASKTYPVSLLTATGSPVALTKCEASTQDTTSRPDLFFLIGVSFRNLSTQPITAIRVQFVSYDAFNKPIYTATIDSQQNPAANNLLVSPGATIDLLGDKSWKDVNRHTARDHITCAITAVRFADGTVWAAPSTLHAVAASEAENTTTTPTPANAPPAAPTYTYSAGPCAGLYSDLSVVRSMYDQIRAYGTEGNSMMVSALLGQYRHFLTMAGQAAQDCTDEALSLEYTRLTWYNTEFTYATAIRSDMPTLAHIEGALVKRLSVYSYSGSQAREYDTMRQITTDHYTELNLPIDF